MPKKQAPTMNGTFNNEEGPSSSEVRYPISMKLGTRSFSRSPMSMKLGKPSLSRSSMSMELGTPSFSRRPTSLSQEPTITKMEVSHNYDRKERIYVTHTRDFIHFFLFKKKFYVVDHNNTHGSILVRTPQIDLTQNNAKLADSTIARY